LPGYWQKFARERISRRHVLRSGAAFAAGAAALTTAGCGESGGSDAPPPPTPGVSADGADVLNMLMPPRPGGRLILAHPATFGTWDPHTGIAVASAYFPRLYNVLVNFSPSKPEFVFNDLAASYETPDETTYIFHMRPGVRIGPNALGVPERDLDGEDVRVTMERIGETPAANNYSFVTTQVESVRVDGDRVTMTTPRPYAWFLNRIGLFTNCIVPRELLEGDVARLSNAAAGAGPYALHSVTENDTALMRRNPGYYRTDPSNGGAQLPYIDEIEVRVIFDPSTLRAAFETGQIMFYMTGTGAEARSLSDAVVARSPAFTFISFTMNGERKPFDDGRVRRAVSLAINRQEYIDIIYGGDADANGIVHWPMGAYALPAGELNQQYQRFDPAEARALIEAAGGLRLQMIYPASAAILEHESHLPIFVEQMRAAGIEIDHRPLDLGSWIETFRKRDYDCSLSLNQQYETPEVPLAFHAKDGPFGDRTYVAGLGVAEIDAAIDRAGSTVDFDERVEAVHEAQRVIYGHVPLIHNLVTPYNHLAWRRVVKNIPTGIGTSSFLVNTMWLDDA
jgi:peptide/nickel transport system substrate-binding protein